MRSGEGGSPKMKNLMKAPMRITTESWPRRRPWVKDSLKGVRRVRGRRRIKNRRGAYEDSGRIVVVLADIVGGHECLAREGIASDL